MPGWLHSVEQCKFDYRNWVNYKAKWKMVRD